ncbi:PH domain-containing protein [Patescibacteria group bacterium]|nr:PH domain-containing protein [Patescibacteria group bacterium]MCL5797407.1 PH domain-containing protein [Patescibacteria group bacterium]
MRIILLQLLFSAVYLLIFIFENSFDLPPPYKSRILTFTIAVFIVLILFQIYGTLHMIFDWLGQHYEIKPGEIIFRYGIILHKEKRYTLQHIESISLNQGLIEKLMNYGTIRLYNPLLKQHIFIPAIKNPQKYIQLIEKFLPETKTGTDVGIIFSQT